MDRSFKKPYAIVTGISFDGSISVEIAQFATVRHTLKLLNPTLIMLPLKEKIVTDESMKPIAVLIAYKDWEKIEQILENYQPSASDLNQFAGVLKRDGEDPLEFQQRIRSEWD